MTRWQVIWLSVLSAVVGVMLVLQLGTLIAARNARLAECRELSSPGAIVFCEQNVGIF